MDEQTRAMEAIPTAIAEQVVAMGKVEWGATDAFDDAGHLAHLADSLRITRENFNYDDNPVRMHGLYLEGTETVLCHTGTSPNSGVNAQALAGAWNWLVDQCAQGAGTVEAAIAEKDAEYLPKTIGRLHLGDRRSGNERLCSHGHVIPDGHPLYWPERHGQHDDSDPYCLTHAIERSESEQGWPDAEKDAEIASLREALEWYAQPHIYEAHPHGPAFDRRDLSWHAKSVLANPATRRAASHDARPSHASAVEVGAGHDGDTK